MKKILSFIMILIVCLSMLSSCGSKQAGNVEGNEKERPVSSKIRNYEDFVKFQVTGEIDAKEYPNASIWMNYYRMKEGTFVDVKELFDLYDRLSTDSEYVIMEEEGFSYTGQTKNGSNIHLDLQYHSDTSFRNLVRERFSKAKSLHEARVLEGKYLYQTDKIDIMVESNEENNTISLYTNEYSIKLKFITSADTKELMTEYLGEEISTLMFGEEEDALSVLEEIYKKIENR